MRWLKLRSRLTITVAIAVFFALLFFSALTATAITDGLTEDVIYSTEDGLNLAEENARAALSEYVDDLQRGVDEEGWQQEIDRLERRQMELDDIVDIRVNELDERQAAVETGDPNDLTSFNEASVELEQATAAFNEAIRDRGQVAAELEALYEEGPSEFDFVNDHDEPGNHDEPAEPDDPPEPPDPPEPDELDESGAGVLLLDLEGAEIDPDDLIGKGVVSQRDGRVNRMTCKTRIGATSCNVETNGIDSATGERFEEIVSRIADDSPEDREQAIVAELLFVDDEPAAVAVATRARPDVSTEDVPPLVFVVIAGVLTAIITGITWFTLRRAMRPVELIIDRVDGIEADSLDQRVPIPKANDELHRLANTMNRMLDRLQRSRDGQRQFISDASHELRSPITATQATLEVARANPDDTDWGTVAGVLTEENDRLASLVDDLLMLARLDEQPRAQPGVPIDLDELCLAEAARPHPVPVSVRIERPARVVGRLPLLTRALRNLVDNAASHANSAVEIVVDVQQLPYGAGAVVKVIDDGPGVNLADSELIFERFARADSARSRPEGRGGAGLGLAIVREVAIIHGGSCVVDPTPSDGACFVLSLPLQPTTMPPPPPPPPEPPEPPAPPRRPTTGLVGAPRDAV